MTYEYVQRWCVIEGFWWCREEVESLKCPGVCSVLPLISVSIPWLPVEFWKPIKLTLALSLPLLFLSLSHSLFLSESSIQDYCLDVKVIGLMHSSQYHVFRFNKCSQILSLNDSNMNREKRVQKMNSLMFRNVCSMEAELNLCIDHGYLPDNSWTKTWRALCFS